MKTIFVCEHCKQSYGGEGERNKCPECGREMLPTGIDVFEWRTYTEEKKNEIRNNPKSYIFSNLEDCRNQDEYIKKKKFELYHKIHNIKITTWDIKQDYEVIGPVYFQLNDLGSTFNDLKKEYHLLLGELSKNGQRSNDRISGLETLGAIANIASILAGGPQDRDLLGNSHSSFDIAFFIACEELKNRAYSLGADMIIGMKQDIDLDTTGFQHFYLQMYGTAIKLK